jgi:WD40 repeat protein
MLTVLVVVASVTLLCGAALYVQAPLPWPSSSTPVRGDDTSSMSVDDRLAAQLAGKADRLRRGDPLAEIQFRLAAHTLAPDNAAYRTALAQLLLGPRPLATVTTALGPVTALGWDPTSSRLVVGGGAGVQEVTGDLLAPNTGPVLPAGEVSAVGYTGTAQIVAAAADGVRELTPAPTLSATAEPGTGPTGVGQVTPAATGPGGVVSGESVHAWARLGRSAGWTATTRDGRLVVWDGAEPSGPASRVLTTGLGPAAPVAASPDGRYIVAPGPGGVSVWDATTGRVAGVVGVDGPILALAIGGGDRFLLVGQATGATLWNIGDPGSTSRLATVRPGGAVTSAGIAPDGRSAATADPAGITVWGLSSTGAPAPVARLPVGGAAVLAYADNSAVLATGARSIVATWSLGELLTYRPAEIGPAEVTQAGLDQAANSGAAPAGTARRTYLATNADASYLIAGTTAGPAEVWATEAMGVPGRALRDVGEAAVVGTGASLAGDVSATRLVVYGGSAGAWAGQVASPGVFFSDGHLADQADTAAVAADRSIAVVATGTTAMVVDLRIEPRVVATITYPSPTTALAMAGQSTVIAGHADGSVTVHTIDLDHLSATRRHLDGGSPSPVDAVALSGTGDTAVAVHADGTISVVDPASRVVAVARAAAGPGPHTAWLSAAGDVAIVSGSGRTVLWGLFDRTHPAALATLISADTTVPAAVSGDGATAIEIDGGDTLTVWDLRPVTGVLSDPTRRACALADLGYQRWHQIAAGADTNTPCAPPPVPTLDSGDAATPGG